MSLEGKVVLISGGGAGIGRAIAIAFARQGADVVVNDVVADRLREVVGEVEGLERRGLALVADVANPQEVAAMLEQAHQEFPHIDILVNAASIRASVPFPQMSTEQWQRIIAVNMNGAFYCARGVIEGMMSQHWGRIINISSMAAQIGESLAAHYSAAKAGILGFTRALAREVGVYGITVNAIAPGPIPVPGMLQNLDPRYVQRLTSGAPIKRLGTVEDIAHVAVFLASEEAGFITGQVISPSGGRYM